MNEVAGGKNKINGHDRELDKIHERQKRGAISISIYIQGLKWTGMIENWDLHQQFFARLLLLLWWTLAAPQLPVCICLLGSALVSYLWKTPAKVGFTTCLLSAHRPSPRLHSPTIQVRLTQFIRHISVSNSSFWMSSLPELRMRNNWTPTSYPLVL